MPLLSGSLLAIALAGADVPAATLDAIAAGYRGPVEQSFTTHCGDCHGRTPTTLAEPARSFALKKGPKARKRMDMTDGFPFGSRWELPRLMSEIRKATAGGDMPPKRWLEQKGVAPTQEERQAMADWATAAERLLKGPK